MTNTGTIRKMPNTKKYSILTLSISFNTSEALTNMKLCSCQLCLKLAHSLMLMFTVYQGPAVQNLRCLVNTSLKFQTSISEIIKYFLLKKCEKLWHCKYLSHFSKQKKISVYLVIKSKKCNEMTFQPAH